MRVLLVSSYPPRHCGIGVYARTQAERLRADGHAVTVLSPPDGDGDIRVPFLGGRAFLRAAAIGARFDRIVVHFQPALYYRPRAPVSKVLTSSAFVAPCTLNSSPLIVETGLTAVRSVRGMREPVTTIGDAVTRCCAG